MVSFKKKSESLLKYVTCALKWARKLPRKTETYESAKCVPCNTRKCTHNGFVSDLLKCALKCRFYATGPRHRLVTGPLVQQKYSSRITLQQSISHLVISTELEKLQIDLPLHAAEVSHPLPKLSPVTPEPVSTAFRFALKQRSRLFEQVICFVLFCSHPNS